MAEARSLWRGGQVLGMGTPSSGGFALSAMLNLLEAVDMAALPHNGAEYLHRLIDAQNIAWADRNQARPARASAPSRAFAAAPWRGV